MYGETFKRSLLVKVIFKSLQIHVIEINKYKLIVSAFI